MSYFSCIQSTLQNFPSLKFESQGWFRIETVFCFDSKTSLEELYDKKGPKI